MAKLNLKRMAIVRALLNFIENQAMATLYGYKNECELKKLSGIDNKMMMMLNIKRILCSKFHSIYRSYCCMIMKIDFLKSTRYLLSFFAAYNYLPLHTNGAKSNCTFFLKCERKKQKKEKMRKNVYYC